MGEPEITRQLDQMRRDWDQRARENARHYVVTGQPEWSDEDFFESGETTMQEEILSDLGNICQGQDPKQMRVLEIGCGAGRITRALSRFFGEVYAVDISREMVRRARQAVAGFPNAHVFRNNGQDLSVLRPSWWRRAVRFGWGGAPRHFDFAFSTLVFQHIPSRRIIENYVNDVSKLLKPGALFKFQVQGCGEVEQGTEDSWVGVSFTEEEVRQMAGRCHFDMKFQYGAGSQYYWIWFFKK